MPPGFGGNDLFGGVAPKDALSPFAGHFDAGVFAGTGAGAAGPWDGGMGFAGGEESLLFEYQDKGVPERLEDLARKLSHGLADVEQEILDQRRTQAAEMLVKCLVMAPRAGECREDVRFESGNLDCELQPECLLRWIVVTLTHILCAPPAERGGYAASLLAILDDSKLWDIVQRDLLDDGAVSFRAPDEDDVEFNPPRVARSVATAFFLLQQTAMHVFFELKAHLPDTCKLATLQRCLALCNRLNSGALSIGEQAATHLLRGCGVMARVQEKTSPHYADWAQLVYAINTTYIDTTDGPSMTRTLMTALAGPPATLGEAELAAWQEASLAQCEASFASMLTVYRSHMDLLKEALWTYKESLDPESAELDTVTEAAIERRVEAYWSRRSNRSLAKELSNWAWLGQLMRLAVACYNQVKLEFEPFFTHQKAADAGCADSGSDEDRAAAAAREDERNISHWLYQQIAYRDLICVFHNSLAVWPYALRMTERLLSGRWERSSDRRALELTLRGVPKFVTAEQLTDLKTQMSQLYDALMPMYQILLANDFVDLTNEPVEHWHFMDVARMSKCNDDFEMAKHRLDIRAEELLRKLQDNGLGSPGSRSSSSPRTSGTADVLLASEDDSVFMRNALWTQVGEKVNELPSGSCGITAVHRLSNHGGGIDQKVAVKWINVKNEMDQRGWSVQQISQMLHAEICSLSNLRASLPTVADRKASNVVHFVGICSNVMSQDCYEAFVRGERRQVDLGTKVGIVMQFLPNQSITQLIRPMRSSSSSDNRRYRMDLARALECFRRPDAAPANGHAPAPASDAGGGGGAASSTSHAGNNGHTPPANGHHYGGAQYALPGCSNGVCSSPVLQLFQSVHRDGATYDLDKALKFPFSEENLQLHAPGLTREMLRDLVPAPAPVDGVCEALYPRGPDGVFRAPDVPRRVPILLLRLSWRWTLQLMIQSARGLSQCHAVGLLHRDYVPWNQMFDAHYRLKVIDFGFSKKLSQCEDTSGQPRSWISLDNILYYAPESLPGRGGPGGSAYDFKASDVWSMAVVFWELLTLTMVNGGAASADSLLKELRQQLRDAGDTLHEAPEAPGRPGAGERYHLELPLPRAQFMRPALFAAGADRSLQEWYDDSPAGGWMRLRSVLRACWSCDPAQRPSAEHVMAELTQLLADFPALL